MPIAVRVEFARGHCCRRFCPARQTLPALATQLSEVEKELYILRKQAVFLVSANLDEIASPAEYYAGVDIRPGPLADSDTSQVTDHDKHRKRRIDSGRGPLDAATCSS